MSAQIPASLGLARDRLLIVATGAYSASLLPTWMETIRHWYPALELRVLTTESALRFVTPTRLAVTSGAPIWAVPEEVPLQRIFPANVARLREYGFTVLDTVAGTSGMTRDIATAGAPAPLDAVMMALAVAVARGASTPE